MRQPMVAGNWKMNGSRDFTHELLNNLLAGMPETNGVQVVVCPPFPYLGDASALLGEQDVVALGAQNLDYHEMVRIPAKCRRQCCGTSVAAM
jgi:triosephosphate isomerase (TIM)